MAARLVPAGVTLRDQVNQRWPNRDKTSDGWIGDAAHQDRPSLHNPDADGWVHALDLDEDLGEAGAMRLLADQLAACAREGRDGGRILNLVYEDQVCSGTYPATYWTWRGSGYGHTKHLHVSFTDAAERDGSPFPLPILENDMPLTDADVAKVAAAVWARAFREYIDENGNAVLDPRSAADILYGTHRNTVELERTLAGAGVSLTPADVDAVAKRTADLLAARLQA